MGRQKPLGHDELGRPIWARNEKGEPICGKRSQHEKRICQNTARCENGRCALPGHGGKAEGRPLIHGGRSKYLPQDLADKLEELGEGEDLVTNIDNIRLTESLLRQEFEGLKDGLPAEIWKSAIALYDKSLAGGPDGAAAFSKLGEVLRNGLGQSSRLAHIEDLMEQQRRHRETENKRVAMNDANLNVRQANALVAAMKSAIEQEVTDPELRRRLAIRFVGFLRSSTSGKLA